MLHQLTLTRLLSFGKDVIPIDLNLPPGKNDLNLSRNGLNVLIGANGSGKSNLIEAISLLQAMPRDLTKPIRDGGGIQEWLWKGEGKPSAAMLQAVIENPHGQMPLKHTLYFTASAARLEIEDETIENERAHSGNKEPYFYYKYKYRGGGLPALNVRVAEKAQPKLRKLSFEDVDIQQSILAQRKDPDHYPEITYLGQVYGKIKLYRDWQFGRYTVPRLPQPADLPNVHLEENLSNLGLVLNRLQQDLSIKRRLSELLHELYSAVKDFYLHIQGGTVQIFFHETDLTVLVPATRLSDGTLRFLCLLTILLHPEPPPLVCIEEPELGLHPDVLPMLAELLKEAGTRTQLIITTHSADLVDELSDRPEAVLVCEKVSGSTQIKRLDKDELSVWLKDYRLGQLWRRGDIGGNRW